MFLWTFCLLLLRSAIWKIKNDVLVIWCLFTRLFLNFHCVSIIIWATFIIAFVTTFISLLLSTTWDPSTVYAAISNVYCRCISNILCFFTFNEIILFIYWSLLHCFIITNILSTRWRSSWTLMWSMSFFAIFFYFSIRLFNSFSCSNSFIHEFIKFSAFYSFLIFDPIDQLLMLFFY